jgi:hypothetical protein
MRPEIIKFITCALLVTPLIFGGVCFAQEGAKSYQATQSATAFEEALKNVEAQKVAERKALAAKCKEKLSQAVTNWISQKESQKKTELNQPIDQDWDRGTITYFYNAHNDYYLRGYNYKVLSSEIKETDSLTAAIKAQVVISEKIYAEKYHTPDISGVNIDMYYFTISSAITLNMEYRQDNFVVTSTETKMLSKDNSYPEELKKMRL